METWNQWREEHPDVQPDLSNAVFRGQILSHADMGGPPNFSNANFSSADLSGAILSFADFSNANLSEARFNWADLNWADLNWADLSSAHLPHANLPFADLSNANLRSADLHGAILSNANLSNANLSNADLSEAVLVRTNLQKATLTNCLVYGIAAWDINVTEATQSDMIITDPLEFGPTITVENLKIAQFIYLLLNNADIREVIDTIGQKAVLILGRFTPERKAVLDALREKLRSLNFLPIVFDFERPTVHDFTETIMTLAGLSCFIIADITNPKSSPLELQAIVPNYMTPLVPIIQEGEQPFSMFTDLQNRYRDWVLDTLLYDTPSNLINVLEQAIVKPALERQAELLLIKAQGLRTRHVKDYS